MSRERARGVETYKLAGTEDTHRQKRKHRLAQPFVLPRASSSTRTCWRWRTGLLLPVEETPAEVNLLVCTGLARDALVAASPGIEDARVEVELQSEAAPHSPRPPAGPRTPPAGCRLQQRTRPAGCRGGHGDWRPMAHPPGTASRPIDSCSWRPTAGLAPCLVALQPHR
jgi:hypothetical protein